MREPAKTIRDPVHGDIRVLVEDLPLLDAPEVQRLRGVRQLGSAFHVYPGAQHTRFEHALGAYHLASRLVERIRENHRIDPSTCRDVSRREASIIRAVALLHDVTHIPHGHAIEDQDGLFPRHDVPKLLREAARRGVLGEILKKRGIQDAVALHLSEKDALRSRTPFLGLVTHGDLGADILDYLRRDAYFTGLRLDYDDRLLDFVKIAPKTGRVYVDLVKHDMDREDILTELLNLLRCRYVSSERIYYHHAKVASGALVSRAVELAILGGLTRKEVENTTEASFLTLLKNRTYAKDVRLKVEKLLARYEERNLLKRSFVIARPGNEDRQDALVRTVVLDQNARLAIERDIAKSIGVKDASEVILYCPNKKMQLKEASIPVRRAGKGIRPLASYHREFPALRQLIDAYRDLWKLYVFVPIRDKEQILWAGKRVEKVLRKRFPGISNQYRP